MKKLTILIFMVTLLNGCMSQNNSIDPQNKKNDTIMTETENNIIAVSYSVFGGQLGFSEDLTITSDSIIYHIDLVRPKHIHSSFYEKNTPELWDSLLKTIKINELKKIKSGSSNLPVDGTDMVITVATIHENISFSNAYDDTVKDLIGNLETIAYSYQEKSKWRQKINR